MSVFENPETISLGAYLYIADTQLKLLSVFDDLYYDRSDADLLSPAMRRHVVQKLTKLGFQQTSGNIVEHKDSNVRCHIPKSHALGASPFDSTRYSQKREQDFYVLTPTQTACQLIDHYTVEDAVERVIALIKKQPINLFRLKDYLEQKPNHDTFQQAIAHLKYVQRKAVEAEPLCHMRALS